MPKKIDQADIKKKIEAILYLEYHSISIRKITKKLKENYDIKISPQIVARCLQSQNKEGRRFKTARKRVPARKRKT